MELAKFEHQISVGIAKEAGINAGIVAAFIWNEIVDTELWNPMRKDGRKWMSCSIRVMCGVMPYLTYDQIRGALKVLVDKKIIVRAFHNENKFDRTWWYAFTDYGMLLNEKGGIVRDD